MARWSDSSSSVSIRRVHARRVFGSRSHNAPCAREEKEKEKEHTRDAARRVH